jgi:hypothetical protein
MLLRRAATLAPFQIHHQIVVAAAGQITYATPVALSFGRQEHSQRRLVDIADAVEAIGGGDPLLLCGDAFGAGAPLVQSLISGALRSIAFGSAARASAQRAAVQSNEVRMTEFYPIHTPVPRMAMLATCPARAAETPNFDRKRSVSRPSAHAFEKVPHVGQRAVLLGLHFQDGVGRLGLFAIAGISP